MKAPERNTDLVILPNIGKETARLLTAIGIHSADELRQTGAIEAAARIRTIRSDDPPCRSMLAGLEGAIRGVRWHAIPQMEREALWKEYLSRTSEGT
jgi:DNA transformation protein